MKWGEVGDSPIGVEGQTTSANVAGDVRDTMMEFCSICASRRPKTALQEYALDESSNPIVGPSP